MRMPLQPSLAAAMDQAYLRSVELHGDIGLTRETLFTRFQSVIDNQVGREATGETAITFFEQLHTADLYLATACVAPSDAAWRRFALIYRRHVKMISQSVAETVAGANDIAGSVIGYLYLPDGSGRRRIASYNGCGSLANWVGAVVRNLARKQNLEKRRSFDCVESAPEMPDARDCPESLLRAHEYSILISSALLEAGERLSDRERLVLTLRYRHQVQVSELARAYGVGPSSITRQIVRIHKKLHNAITESLSSRHHLSPVDINDCIREMVENPARYVVTLFEN